MGYVIQIGPDGEALLQKLAGFPDEARQAIARGMGMGAALVVGKISRDRFTGQGPFQVSEHRLGVVSNRLRASLRWNGTGLPGRTTGGEPSKIEGDSITSSIGTNVNYLGVHEEGFHGTVQVKTFTRQVAATQFASTAAVIDLKKIKGKKARQAALGTETVRAHSRVMNIPARAPLSTGIGENMQTFSDQIGAALAKAWARKGDS